MEITRLWEIVEAARTAGGAFDQALLGQLRALDSETVVAFGRRFDLLQLELDRRDVWGAAYLIGGGCSDDAFIDFRAGVISLGQEWFERVLAQPDALAHHPQAQTDADLEELLFFEDVNYVPARAYRELTGSETFPQEPVRHDRDLGEEFDFDDDDEMVRRCPALAALYLWSRTVPLFWP